MSCLITLKKIRTRNKIDCESEVRMLVLLNMHTKHFVMGSMEMYMNECRCTLRLAPELAQQIGYLSKVGDYKGTRRLF